MSEDEIKIKLKFYFSIFLFPPLDSRFLMSEDGKKIQLRPTKTVVFYININEMFYFFIFFAFAIFFPEKNKVGKSGAQHRNLAVFFYVSLR